MTPIADPAVQAKFDAYPPKVKRKMLALRELLLRTAAATPGVGEIDESLKWGEPAYRPKNQIGSTIRMDWKAKAPATYAMYFHCQTNLIETFRRMFPRDFTFSGNRAIVFQLDDEAPPQDALAVCIAAALTYHAAKKE